MRSGLLHQLLPKAWTDHLPTATASASASPPPALLPAASLHVQLFTLLVVLLLGLSHRYVPFLLRKYRAASPSTSRRAEASLDGLKDERIATVSAIYVYPVKSCAAVSLEHAKLHQKGLELDRRWMVVKRVQNQDGTERLDKLSLRDEERLTLIQPQIDEAAGALRLSLSPHAATIPPGSLSAIAKKPTNASLPLIQVPLRPTKAQLDTWLRLEKLAMYGDFADARLVPLMRDTTGAKDGGWTGTPSAWVSEFLGYPVHLVMFDPYTDVKRNVFPTFRPPAKVEHGSERDDIDRWRPIEFQDEYPLLVGTDESLAALNEQISRAARGALLGRPSDGLGGEAIKNFDASRLRAATERGRAIVAAQRFRPNLVVRSRTRLGADFEAYSEDSWERLWVEGRRGGGGGDALAPCGRKLDVALVARCKRCLLTAVDPETSERDFSVPLAFLRRNRTRDKKYLESGVGVGPCWGCYGVPLPVVRRRRGAAGTAKPTTGGADGRPTDERTEEGEDEDFGSVAVGDEVWVRWRPYANDDEPMRKRPAGH